MVKKPSHENIASQRMETRAMGLVYVSDAQPGWSRRRRGKGFSYCDADGHPITARSSLDRIHALAIPPAYTHVWICSNPCGHLQATGWDVRGRKQYRYHRRWRKYRDFGKFDRIVAFGKALPALRQRVRRDLALEGLPRDKLSALLVRLLDDTLIRIGNDRYTRDNRSYGLTTLRSRHVRAQRGRLRFTFRGKSGKDRDVELDDRRLVRIVRRVQQLPGQRLFQYIDDNGELKPVDSDMVNEYLRAACGNGQEYEFSAKDFRTWGGTMHAARILVCTPRPRKGGEQAHRRALSKAVSEVAAILGNTPAVCRGSYIHPRLLDGWLDGSLQRTISSRIAAHPRKLEKQMLRFLR